MPPNAQDVPSTTGEALQVPGSAQVSAVQGLPSSQTTGLAETQLPPWQDSVPLQARLSLHDVPSERLVRVQPPLVGLHVATWQVSPPVQVTGLLPVQTPVWQVSVWVQALPSSHEVPSGLGALLQPPSDGSQTPARWQASAGQVWNVPPAQIPAWQVSPTVQALPSLQGVPFTFGT